MGSASPAASRTSATRSATPSRPPPRSSCTAATRSSTRRCAWARRMWGRGRIPFCARSQPRPWACPSSIPKGAGEAPLIEMVTDDSSQAPNAGSASASRMTFMGGRAVHDAAAEALASVERGRAPGPRHRAVPPHAALRPSTRETTAGRPNYRLRLRGPGRGGRGQYPHRQCAGAARSSACTTWARPSTASRWRARSRAAWRRPSATPCSKISRCATARS